MLISYTSTVTTGQSIIVTNQVLGTQPFFKVDYNTTRNGKALSVRLYQCTASKLSMAFKLEDYMMPEIDFGVLQNSAGQVMDLVYPELS